VHGGTPVRPGEDLNLGSLAAFVADCCDVLELDGIDLVANDTDGDQLGDGAARSGCAASR